MKKYRIGYTCGVFDLFHVGHLNLLERCKQMCDKLIVGVCDDEYVKKIKNKIPIYNQNDRLRIISSLRVVDVAKLVTIEEIEDKILAWNKFRFDVLFSGDDWKNSARYKKTEEQLNKMGDVKVEYLPYTKGISTSLIKETIITNK